ncbi:MAG: iron-containing redox enzyme family protein [Hylemonella sp.]|nr:iron-containing redox enzyme family protein [Burkholderiaceae bacterium]MDO9090067.1 iron-containing redox enzyme family protein [Burkholderiaceae bacterium]MDP1936765.1 iron-containing redox enzyme family protein [Hylemonella sp.]
MNMATEPNKFRPAASGAVMSEDELIGIVKHLLKEFGHDTAPLVQKIAAGTATREQIIRLGINFQNFTRITPNVLGTLYSRCYDHAVRRKIFDNLIDEDTGMRCGDQPHYELAMEFITRFSGMSWDEVVNHPICYEVQDINNFRLRTAKEVPVAVAMGAFGLAGEAGFSAAAAAVSDGLREHYGVKDEDQVSWIVHIEGDEEHSEVAEAIVRKLIRKADDQQLIIRLCAEYLDRWQYLYGTAEDPNFKLKRSALREFEQAIAG